MNVPLTIALVVSAKPELYPALCTVLGVEQLYDILEVIVIDTHNLKLLKKQAEGRNRT